MNIMASRRRLFCAEDHGQGRPPRPLRGQVDRPKPRRRLFARNPDRSRPGGGVRAELRGRLHSCGIRRSEGRVSGVHLSNCVRRNRATHSPWSARQRRSHFSKHACVTANPVNPPCDIRGVSVSSSAGRIAGLRDGYERDGGGSERDRSRRHGRPAERGQTVARAEREGSSVQFYLVALQCLG